MPTDSFFTQGSTHRICQDYATHGANYAIVSDGCSSALDSDFGARLLTRAAIQALTADYELGSEAFYNCVLRQAASYAQAMGLHEDCLFATLTIAQQIGKEFVVAMKGDGVIVAQYPNYFYVCSLEFENCAPFFLRYHLNEESLKNYETHVGTKYNRHEYIVTPTLVTKAETECQVNLSNASVELHKFNTDEVQSVAIMSDGVSAFFRTDQSDTHKQSIKVDFIEVIRELMTFRNFNDGFVERRCQMAFKKFDKLGWKPFDDFSIGVVANAQHS